MKPLDLEAFLSLPEWSDNVRHVLRTRAWRDDVLALAAVRQDGKLVAQAWTRWPRVPPDGLEAFWSKYSVQTPAETASRTAQAVALVDQGMTAYAAAKQLGIQQSAVSRALARRAARRVCPACRQVVRAPSPAPASA